LDARRVAELWFLKWTIARGDRVILGVELAFGDLEASIA
jgi:hypothetical protein